jgi:RNA polymerase sigma factor (sigma-70 family)
MNHADDKYLLDLIHHSDNASYAFNLIIRKYQEKIYWHIRRLVIDHEDTNDLVQDTFVKAWKGVKNFRGDSMLYTWLYRIATNETLTFLKKKKQRFFLPWHDVENLLHNKIDENADISAHEIQKRLLKAIARLPEKQRVVFTLRYYDEMTYEQISEVLGTSVGALKASYHHAAKKINEFVLNA